MRRTYGTAIPFGLAGMFVALGVALAVLLGSGSAEPTTAVAGGNAKPVITTFELKARGTKSEKFTNSTKVNVNLVATDDVKVVKYYLCDACTEPPIPGSIAWLTVKPLNFTTYSAQGVHTVRAWVQDGNENISKPVVDKIFYDSVKANHSINSPRSQECLNSLTRFGGNVNELLPSSGIASAEYSILRRKDCSWWDPKKEELVKGRCGDPAWVTFPVAVTAKAYGASIGTLNITGTYSLTVRLIDRAGNVALRTQKFFIN